MWGVIPYDLYDNSMQEEIGKQKFLSKFRSAKKEGEETLNLVHDGESDK